MHRPCLPSILMVFLMLFIAGPSQAADLQEDRSVLLIWGTPFMGPWGQNFNQIVMQDWASELQVPVIPEFLSLLNASASQQAVLAESMSLKYSNTQIDLVIAVLPEANSFVYQWHEKFSPGAPILSVLPGEDIYERGISNYPNSILPSAVSEATLNTLQLIPRLLPATQRLFIVGGSSAGDESYLERMGNVADAGEYEFDVSYLRGLPPEELVATLNTAPLNSAVLLGTYSTDRTGQPHRTLDVGRLLSSETQMPVFSILDSLVREGGLGGSVSSSTLYAQTAVSFAARTLAGEAADLSSAVHTIYMFDADQLDRFDIRRSSLPEGSLILNDGVDLFGDYALQIFGVAMVLLVQFVLIASLLQAMAKRRLAEKALHESQKLDALGSLAGGIAHDFNNILMAIVGNAEFVTLNTNNPSMVKSLAGDILKAADRAKRLVAQILMFGRSANEEEQSSIHLENLIAETVSQLRASSEDSINFDVVNAPDLCQVKCNATQIHQVLTNLCVNAEYGMANVGTVSIATRNISILKPTKLFGMTAPAGDYVTISVADRGMGISSKDLTRIFEPFFTTKPHGQGSGLGLALVYRIVKEHDGYIDVDSKVGRGTTVTIYLRAHQDAVMPEPATIKEQVSKGNGALILLVDDDQMVLDSSALMLTRLGYRVESYANPTLALSEFLVAPNKFDIMITDLSMPEIDGVRLSLKVRRVRPDLPIILRTGFSHDIDTQELRGLENFSLMKKPCSMEETSTAIRNSLLGSRWHDGLEG